MHQILFIIFMFSYIYIAENQFPNHPGLMSGIGITIGGLWGLLSKQMLFKTGFNGEKQAMVVNAILFIAGAVITILAFLYE
ncbi:hypothetical protein [Orenia marismortui]|uniref:Uncharacterized protein n=1 Tax=Orenia marismortui TaxID=46469 RepID=A0A4R8H182_9FIRM|nr:hypothetical protein [Orenia marismortui]TDX53267.1 hypothetical protein C7959_103119 [Orenia marismortui]